ncbi:MAG: enoyl-CoA hydratase-related protein [Leptospiraceae bacterium]|nr:enoyl-CoA hydratase-related protein [Leptospiraceae bacterium]MDW7975578.1 enoyl-CoA hydratase-related protein [Leptospiraceae bacterium]
MQNKTEFQFFQVEKQYDKKTAIIYLNQPNTRNTLEWQFWIELPSVIEEIENDSNISVAIIAGKGKSFSIGLDLVEFYDKFKDIIQSQSAEDRETLFQTILKMQEGLKKIITGKKIYIAAVHKHCYGGGLDLIAACDLRIASKNAIVSLRETKVGIVADMGSLNRLPFIIGFGATKLMAYTGRDFTAEECFEMGLFEKIVEKEEDLLPQAIQLAEEIASNPSIVLWGIKQVLNYMETHNTLDGMNYVALWNSTFLDSKEFRSIIENFIKKQKKRNE